MIEESVLQAIQAQIAHLEARLEASETRLAEVEGKLKRIARFHKHDDSVTLRANHVQVLAPNGHSRVELVAELDEARVVLCDKFKLHAEFRADFQDDTDTVYTSDDAEKMRAVVGQGQLVLYGREMKESVRLAVDEGGGVVQVAGVDGTPAAQIKSSTSGGIVSVVDKDGQPRIAMIQDENGGWLEVLGANNKSCASVRAQPNGGFVRVRDSEGEQTATLLAGGPGHSALVLGDTDTRAIRLTTNKDTSLIDIVAEGAGQIRLAGLQNEASLEILNQRGNTVAKLNTLQEGGALSLHETDGQMRVFAHGDTKMGSLQLKLEDSGLSLTGLQDGGFLMFRDAQGQDRLTLHSGALESQLLMSHGKDQPAVHLIAKRDDSHEPDHEGCLTFFDKSKSGASMRAGGPATGFGIHNDAGEVVGVLMVGPDGGDLKLSAHDGSQRVRLIANEDGGAIGVMSETGSPRASLGVDHDDHGQLMLFLSGGEASLIAGGDETGGCIVFYDEGGEPNLHLPRDEA